MADWLIPEIFDPNNSLLVPDRSLSSLGRRRLQYFRSQNLWPSPGVFSFPQLAKKILTEKSRFYQDSKHKIDCWEENRNSKELLKSLHEMQNPLFENKSLRDRFRTYRGASDFLKFPLNVDNLIELVKEIESDPNKELKEVSLSLLILIHLKLAAHHQNALLSPWDRIPLACQALDDQNIKWNWSRILDSAPQSNIKILVDSHMDLFPLEQLLLTSLSKHLEVRIFPKILEKESIQLEELQSQNLAPNNTLFWAWPSSKAQCGEIHEYLGSRSEKLDLPQTQPLENSEYLRSLVLYLDYHFKNKPAFHNFLRSPKAQEQIKNSPISHEATIEGVEKYFQKHFPDDYEDLLNIKPFVNFLNPDDICFLKELSFFKASRRVEIFQNSHPEGSPLLTLEDFPWCASQNTLLWSNSVSLAHWCESDSAEVLSRRIFPAQVESWLEAEGYSVPNPSREATRLKSLLETYKSHVKIVNFSQLHNKAAQKAPDIKHTDALLDIKKLSPTGLETYTQCPRKFYYQRVLRLNEKTMLDDIEIAPLQKGSWLHLTLESFFKKPGWENSHQQIKEILENSVSEIFSSVSSHPQQEIIKAQGHKLSIQLASHINEFEKTLNKNHTIIERKMEHELSMIFDGITLRGFVDRIDILKNGVLIWDYKTGSTHKSSHETLFKNGYFQWWIYKRIWEVNNPNLPVLGGAYLNPLNPKSSRLIVLNGGESLASTFETLSYPYDALLNTDEAVNFEKAIWDHIKTTLCKIREHKFEALPIKDNQCDRCSVKNICGKPYLEAQ